MPHKRAANMRTVTISIPRELIARIDELATQNERSRSKMIELILRSQLDQADVPSLTIGRISHQEAKIIELANHAAKQQDSTA